MERRAPSLSGKVAIITGAASGQGAAEAALFVELGARVVATDISPDGAALTGALGDAGLFLQHDVSREDQWSAVVRRAEAAFGGVDILVNNAGVYDPAPVQATSATAFDRHYRINQLGAFLGMSAAIPALRRRGGGSIVNISSVGGVRGYAGEFAYCASKWAVTGMTRCAAINLAPFGIRVNSVHPGPIDTPMLGQDGGEDEIDWSRLTPMGRLGRPAEVAALVAFLASDQSSYITGSAINIDGGLAA